MDENAEGTEIEDVQRAMEASDCAVHVLGRSLVAVSGRVADDIAALPGVESVEPIATPYKLVARAVRPEGSRVRLGDVEVGGREFIVAAGPCAVETEQQVHAAAMAVAAAGAR